MADETPLTRGDRVVWDRGPEYGKTRGPGVIVGVRAYTTNLPLLARVRFDDPGLDDEEIEVDELSREDG